MLTGDSLKYFSLIAGIAFATLLIAQQSSIFCGLMWRTGVRVRDLSPGVDLWVMDPLVEFTDDNKPMRSTAVDLVRGVPGVEWAVPMYQGILLVRLPDGTQKQGLVLGLDDATLVGGPPEMVKGSVSDLRRDDAIIIDQTKGQVDYVFTDERGERRMLAPGDRVTINDRSAQVVGVSKMAKEFFFSPVVFTTYSRALRFAPPQRRQLSYVLVNVQDSAQAQQVADRIREATGLAAWTPSQFAWNSLLYTARNTGIPINFGISIALGFIIGVLVVGQTFFNFVLDNTRYFAALKANGLTNGKLIVVVLLQLAIVCILGYGIGMGAAGFFGLTVGRPDADLAFAMFWFIPATTAVAIAIVGVLSAVLSLWRVLRLEPAVVFK
jgi:putative ABC transport system permease protein